MLWRRNETMRKIELSLNGYYLATTTQSKTCKEAVRKVREIAKHRPVVVAGRGEVAISESDRVTARFQD